MIQLDPKFHLVQEKRAPFYTPFEKQVEEIWQKGIAEGKLLFEGQIFRPISFTPEEMVGDFISYRYFYGQTKGLPLHIHTAGVTAIIQKEDQVLLAQRAENLAYLPGLWEFAPSGTLSKLDLKEQMVEELQEEIGVTVVHKITPFLLIQEREIFEICMKVECECPENLPIGEYQAFAWVPLDLLASFIQANAVCSNVSLIHSFLE